MHRTLTVDGLHVEVADGDGDAVVLVHAGVADSGMWHEEVAALTARGHRVIIYDVRGFGRSAEPTGPYYDHEDLVAVLDACEVRRAIVVGASNGGRIALDAALEAPDRVAALALVGANVPGMPMDAHLQAGHEAEDAALATGDVEAATRANLATWVTGYGRAESAVPTAVRDRVAAWLAELLPRQATREHGAQLVRPLVRDRLGEITVPTIAIVGEHDVPRMVAAAAWIAGSVPRGRLELVRGAAHLASLEQPATVLALLTTFLEEVGRRGEVRPDEPAVAAFWADAALGLGREPDSQPPPAWAFGDSGAMADELVELVLRGTKRATAGAVIEYEAEGEPIPRAGDLSIVLDGAGLPRCVIRTTEVRVGPLGSVDAAFAFDEGEMDRTLATWLAGHLRFFHRTLPPRFGIEVDLDLQVAFERFEVVHPSS